MQSGETNQSISTLQRNEDPQIATLTHTNIRPEIPQTAGVKVRAEDLRAGMIPGETPIDFIRKNMREPTQQVDPQKILEQVQQSQGTSPEPVVAKQPNPPTPAPETSTPVLEYDIQTPEDKKETLETKTEEPQSAESDETKEHPGAGDFKRLRGALKEANTNLAAVREEKERLQADLEKYKNGEAFPDILQEKENRIAELSRYEKLVALKTSKEYREAYIRPLSVLETKLTDYGKEYNVPPEVMNKILNAKTTPELNRLLEDHFDSVGALEVKQIIGNVRELQAKAREAEAEPAQELEKLQEQHQAIETQRREQRRSSVIARSKDAWVNALTTVQKEGKITPLVYRENDSEFNERYAVPLRTKAAQEFSRIMTELINNGLEDLPEEAATALANYVLHAHASAVNFEFGKAALNYADEVEKHAHTLAPILRPDIGGSGSGTAPATTSKPIDSPQAAASAILQRHVLRGS